MHDCHILSFALSESSAVHTDHVTAVAKFAVFRMFSFQRDKLGERGDRIAYSVSVSKAQRIHGESKFFDLTEIGSFASLMARRVISLFASLRNSFTESSATGANHEFPFNANRIIGGGPACRREPARMLSDLFYAVNF